MMDLFVAIMKVVCVHSILLHIVVALENIVGD